MVSTYHQQYLCPDFLNPINNPALDSNKSPLALLAQTCNSIGVAEPHLQQHQGTHGHKRKHSFDGVGHVTTSGTFNAVAAAKDKSTRDESPPPTKQHKAAPSSNAKSASKPSPHQADSTTSSGDLSPTVNNTTTNNFGLSPSNNDKQNTSICQASTRTASDPSTTVGKGSPTSDGIVADQSSLSLSTGHVKNNKSPSSSSPVQQVGTNAPSANVDHVAQLAPPYHPSFAAPSLAAAGSALTSSSAVASAALNPFFGAAGFLYPSVHPAQAPSYGLAPGGFYPPMGAALPSAYYPGISPSLMAAYPKICLDPYCKTCPAQSSLTSSSSHLPSHQQAVHRPPCPPGCAQCSMALTVGGAQAPDYSAWLGAYSSLFNVGLNSTSGGGHGMMNGATPLAQAPPLTPFFSPYYASMLMAMNPLLSGHALPLPGVASPSAHPQAIHQPQQQPVCWWDNGDGFCMKRFSNAEEFFQHLRSHAQEAAQKVSGASNNRSGHSSHGSTTSTTTSSSTAAPSLPPPTQPLISPSSGGGSTAGLGIVGGPSYNNPSASTNAFSTHHPMLNSYSNPSIAAAAYSNLGRFYPTAAFSGAPKFGVGAGGGVAPPGRLFSPSAADLVLPPVSLASYNAALLSSMFMQQQHRLPYP